MPAQLAARPWSDVSLEGVLVALRQGDREAFEVVYDRTAPRIYGLCLRLLRDRSLAEEVAQDVLLTLWVDAERFDPDRGSAMAWVLTLTHRKAVDRVRTTVSTRRRDNDWHRASTEVDADFTVESALSSVASADVRRAMAELSVHHREVLTLAYFEGLTHTQVAATLDIPLGTAKTRIRDGLHMLRRRLAVDTVAAPEAV